jgi:uncharacterized protein
MNHVQYFEIQANDPKRAIEFYKTVFGWTFTKQDGMPIDYWHIATDGIDGGLLPRPANAGKAIFGSAAGTKGCSTRRWSN